MYIPAIPRQWAWNYRIPTVYDTVANIVWIVIPGAPWTNFGKSGAQGTYLPDYDVVASYNQDGSWSGDWYVLKANVGGSGGVSLGSRPFVASRSASLNWGLNVCQ